MADRPDNSHVSEALQAAQARDREEMARLLSLVYTELHQLARGFIARLPPGQSLQPTALVHEAYVRLVDSNNATWKDRAHVFAVCARVMRNFWSTRRGRNFRRGRPEP